VRSSHAFVRIGKNCTSQAPNVSISESLKKLDEQYIKNKDASAGRSNPQLSSAGNGKQRVTTHEASDLRAADIHDALRKTRIQGFLTQSSDDGALFVQQLYHMGAELWKTSENSELKSKLDIVRETSLDSYTDYDKRGDARVELYVFLSKLPNVQTALIQLEDAHIQNEISSSQNTSFQLSASNSRKRPYGDSNSAVNTNKDAMGPPPKKTNLDPKLAITNLVNSPGAP
jgi:hypothetical protein